MRTIPKNWREGAEAALRARGLRLTGPRRVVLDVVRATESHPTAERVHQMVRRRLPRVSLGTVYRNLRLLVAEGLVKELPGPHARFDGNLSEHHHFTCLGCGRINDVQAPATDPHARALCGRVAAQSGFRVTHHRIEFYGRCLECQRRAGRKGARGRRPTP
jgi:Fe2+ or Zn2+ uptake regulation protein